MFIEPIHLALLSSILLPILTGKNAMCQRLKTPIKTGRCMDEVRDVMRLYKEKIVAVTIFYSNKCSDCVGLFSSRQIMRFTSDALQALIKGQVGKEFYPLPGMPHIGEAETFTSRIFEPSKSAFEKLRYCVE